MKEKDIKKHIDKINCTEKFKSDMEEKLSAPPDTEYADSVSDVEAAPKWNVSRIGAFAASAVLAAGFVGGGIHLLKNGNDPTEEITEGAEPTEAPQPRDAGIDEIMDDTNGRMKMHTSYYSSDESGQKEGVMYLPDETARKIITLFETTEGELLEEDVEWDGMIIPANTASVTFIMNGSLYYANSQDFFRYGDVTENTPTYGDPDIYSEALTIVARDLPYFDWMELAAGDNEAEQTRAAILDKAFISYRDEIELVDDIKLVDDTTIFFDSYPYLGIANSDGSFLFQFTDKNNEQVRVCFDSHNSDFADLIKEAVNYGATDKKDDNKNYEVFADSSDLIEKFIPDTNCNDLIYITDGSQNSFSVPFRRADLSSLKQFLSSYEWVETDDVSSYERCFMSNRFYIDSTGMIYSVDNGKAYRAPDMDLDKLNTELELIAQDDIIGYMSYMIANSKSNYDNFAGRMKVTFSPLYDTSQTINADVELKYDAENFNEQATLNADYVDYHTEFTRSEYKCTEYHSGAFADKMFADYGDNVTYENGRYYVKDSMYDFPQYSFNHIMWTVIGWLGNNIDINDYSLTFDEEELTYSCYFTYSTDIIKYSCQINLDQNGVPVMGHLEGTNQNTGDRFTEFAFELEIEYGKGKLE